MGAAALLAAVACGGGGGGGSSIPSPVVRSITPATGYSGSATPVVISGDNFLISPTSSVMLAWLDQAALTNVVWIDVHTIHATVPAGLSSGKKTLRVQNAYGKQGSLANAFEVDSLSLGALAATVTATPGTVSVGQAVTLTATVSNVGTGTVTAIQPNEVETSSIDGAAATVTGPDPASVASLAAGDSTTFSWVVVPTAVGHLDLAVSVAGNDVFSGQKVPSPPVTAEVLSQLPAGLVATISASRSTVDANQPVTLTFTVTNGGQAGAIVNAVVSQVLSGTATCQTVTPAPPITVPAGGSRSFAWSCSAASAGVLSLSGSATGVDANSSAPLTASPASPATVTVQAPAALAATLAVDGDPTSASVGQPLAVRLTVRNTGGATAGVTGTALAATLGAAACSSLGPATPQTVPGGTSLVFSWTCLPAVATPLNLTAAVTGSDANTGAALAASASLPSPITVQLPPALVATVSASPGTADVGQPITVLFTVGNGGSAQAKGVAVTPTVAGTAAATCGAVTPGATNIAANGSQIFSWTCTPSSAGALTLSAAATGTDANSGQPVTATPSVSASVTVQAPAALTASIAVVGSPTTVSAGQPLTVRLAVSDSGGASATVASLTASPSGICSAATPTPPQVVTPGVNSTFTWTCTPSSAGSLSLGATLTGSDRNSGAPLTASASLASPITVQLPPALTVSVSASPATVDVSQVVTVTYTVVNGGGAQANGVAVTPTVAGSAGASCGTLTPASANIAAGDSQIYSRSCTPSSAGNLSLSGTASGTDANSGLSVTATPSVSAAVTVQAPAALSASIAVTGSPSVASVGQVLNVTFRVSDTGGASASISTVTPSPSGICTAAMPVPPQVVTPGVSSTFTWTCTPTSAGSLTLGASLTGSDANTGAALTASASLASPIAVQQPPALAATVSATPGTVDVSQVVTVTFTVVNGGGVQAKGVAVTPTVAGTAAATCGAVTPGATSIAANGSQIFSWTCTATSAGPLTLSGAAAGTDANSGQPVTANPPVAASVTVQAPAALSASIAVVGNPTAVSAGQPLTVQLTVTDPGGASATVASVTASPSGICMAAAPAPPQVVTPGVNFTFTFTCTPSSAGSLTLGASLTGSDRNSGAPLTASASLALPITVELPPELTATVSASPATVDVSQVVTVTYTVVNGGGAQAKGVAVAPTVAGSAAATCGAVAPASANIAAGNSQIYSRSCTPSSAGTLSLSGTASGTDANSGLSVTATPSVPASVTVQAPAALSASLAVGGSPTTASVGQVLNVTFKVSDTGGAPASISTVTPSPSGICTAATPVPPQVVTPGVSSTFTWTCTPTSAGSLTLGASLTGSDANTGAALAASASLSSPIAVQLPPALAATVSANPGTVDVSQVVTVTFTVVNGGGAQAKGVAVTPTVAGTAAATCGAVTPGATSVAANGSQIFSWTCTATSAGTLTLSGAAAGTDANSGKPVTANPPVAASVTVQAPAALSASIAVVGNPSTASVGEVLTVQLTVTDPGGASATVATLTASPSGICTAATPPLPQVVNPGVNSTLTFTCTPSSAGSLTLGASLTGSDRNSGAPLTASASVASPITVEQPPALTAAVSASPATADVSQAVTVTYTVVNGGGAQAKGVAVAPTVAGSAAATCGAVTPGATNIAAGDSQVYSRTCTPSSAGTLNLSGTASGTDANSGLSVTATPALAASVTVQAPAALSASIAVSGSPTTASVGQVLNVTFKVSDTGGASASISTVTPSPSGICTAATPVPPQVVTPGVSSTFTWTCTPTSAGSLTLGASLTGSDANTGAALTASASLSSLIAVQLPPALAATVSANPGTVDVSQVVTVTFTVVNGGGAQAKGVAVTPTVAGTAAATCGAVTPGATNIAANGSQLFSWTCTPSSAGTLTLGGAAAGTDANSGQPVTATPPVAASVAVQAPAGLSASIAVVGNPTTASVGEVLTVQLTVTDPGGASATVATLTASPSGICTAATPPLPQVVNPGVNSTFTFTCTPSSAGSLTLGASLTGSDRNSGAPLTASASVASPISVELPSSLTATVSAVPATADVSQAVTVTYTVVNGGGAQANGVAVAPTVGGSAGATCGPLTPASASIVAGGSQIYSRSCMPTTAGSLSLSGTASGTDANSGLSVTATPSVSAAVTVQVPASLSASIAVTGNPTTASVGQVLNVTFTVNDTGEAPASASTVTPSPSGICTAATPVPPQAVTSGVSSTFTWTCTPTSAGSLTLGASLTGSDANTGAALTASASLPSPITVQLPPALAATASASPGTVDVGQDVTVLFTVGNGGTAQANGVAVTPTVAGTAAAICGAVTPGATSITANGSQIFSWTCTPSSAGTLILSGMAAGTDANSGQPVTATPPVAASVAVQAPAGLSASIAVVGNPTTASVGEVLTVQLTVTDPGGASATLATLTASPSGICTAATPPLPQVVNPGVNSTFTFTCTPSSAGLLTLGASLTGSDRNSGAPLTASASLASPITIELPPSLTAAVSASPATVDVAQGVTVTYTVVNGGGAQANGVAVTPTAEGSAVATCGAATPGATSIAANGSQIFSWTCTPTSAGTLGLSGTASGMDANSGQPLTATPSVSASVTVQAPASLSASIAVTGNPTTASVGQVLNVTFTVSDTGQASASISTVTPSPADLCTAAIPVPPQAVTAGVNSAFTWTCTPTSTGDLTLGASLTGTDANTSAPLSASASLPSPISVQ